MLNSHRQTSTPTSAISPATTAVAAPPDHNMRASTLGRSRRGGPYAGSSGEYGRLCGESGDMGAVMVSQAFRQAGRIFSQPGAVLTPMTAIQTQSAGCSHACRSAAGENDFERPRAVYALDPV